MENPWLSLPDQPPYLLSADRYYIESFCARVAGDDRRTIRLDVRPEPYIGAVHAPIVVLQLNPGYTADDKLLHADSVGTALWWANIREQSMPYPFYMLDPRIGWAPGAGWWRRTLNKLIALSDTETVARNVLCVEYFAYHSKGDPRFPGLVPSQQYAFHLVEDAIDRGAAILVTRAARAWRDRVPRLNDYARAYDARNPQQAIVGPGNYPEAFPLIRDLLSRG